MTKRCLLLIVLVITQLAFNANAQKYENGLADKTIALVGNDMILLSEVESEVQMMRLNGIVADRNTRCNILEQMLVSKLFLTQARLDSLMVTQPEIEENVSNRMNQVIAQLGSEKQAEEYFGKPMYKVRESWSEKIEEQLLTQKMQQEVLKKIPKMTPSDIKEAYAKLPEEDIPIVPTQYRLRQIVLYPDKASAATVTKEKLLDLRERIMNGEKFSTLARVYSEDPGSAAKGGELGMMSKSVYWPQFSDAAMSLKAGQVSQIVETPDGFHIIQMIEKQGDMFNARHILLKPTYSSQERTKAFNVLDSIRTEIMDEKITFEVAAWNFSEDPKSRTNGGMMADETTGSAYFEKDLLKPNDYAILKNMKEGEISQPFESLDNEGHGATIYKILLLEKIIPSHTATYENDYNILLNNVNNQNAEKAIADFIKDKQKTTFIRLDPLFQGCDFEREGWVK